MITKGTFGYHFLQRIDITLDHNISIGRYQKLICNALYKAYTFFPEETGKYVFINIFRQWSCCRISTYRIPPECNGYRHPFPCFFPFLIMICTSLMPLPVHSRTLLIENLHPVHTCIRSSCRRVNCMYDRKRYEPSAVVGPAF